MHNPNYKLSELSDRQRRRLKNTGSIKLSNTLIFCLVGTAAIGWIVVANAIMAWKIYHGQHIGMWPEIMFGGGFFTCCVLPFSMLLVKPDSQYFELLSPK